MEVLWARETHSSRAGAILAQHLTHLSSDMSTMERTVQKPAALGTLCR